MRGSTRFCGRHLTPDDDDCEAVWPKVIGEGVDANSILARNPELQSLKLADFGYLVQRAAEDIGDHGLGPPERLIHRTVNCHPAPIPERSSEASQYLGARTPLNAGSRTVIQVHAGGRAVPLSDRDVQWPVRVPL